MKEHFSAVKAKHPALSAPSLWSVSFVILSFTRAYVTSDSHKLHGWIPWKNASLSGGARWALIFPVASSRTKLTLNSNFGSLSFFPSPRFRLFAAAPFSAGASSVPSLQKSWTSFG